MPNYKSQDGKLHFLSDEDVVNGGVLLLPIGSVSITEQEAEAIRLENEPVDDPELVRKSELRSISDEMMASGAWESALYVVMKYSIQEARTKYPTQTAGMTDDQIDVAMSDESSPYYNENYAKGKNYYQRIKDVS